MGKPAGPLAGIWLATGDPLTGMENSHILNARKRAGPPAAGMINGMYNFSCSVVYKSKLIEQKH